ncbi:hypothetical protein [Enterovirga aerilata]|uniref:Uncharacterized protein n=1 Tax=Enterovirga aerilata TaxID=2730920 RepID=A0A849IFT7_9HYPH|nr:hypothetical protein [Enterovirga sp. DB1703]NNM75020.1 hypothetical protein [Enterovirga sp. DB1703]
MALTTYYVLQEFEFAKRRWRPKLPRQVQDRGVAERAVARLRSLNQPALAFSRVIDPETGECEDPEIIASFNVPPEFLGETAEF